MLKSQTGSPCQGPENIWLWSDFKLQKDVRTSEERVRHLPTETVNQPEGAGVYSAPWINLHSKYRHTLKAAACHRRAKTQTVLSPAQGAGRAPDILHRTLG